MLIAACERKVEVADGDVWHVRGTVVTLSPTELEVRHSATPKVDLGIDARTEVFVNHRPASFDVIHEGTRVTVMAVHNDSGVWARRIDIFR